MASRVQFKDSGDNSTSTIVFDSNVTSGNLCIFFTRIGDSTTEVTGVSSNVSTEASFVRALRVVESTHCALEIWWAVFNASGACTLTITGGLAGSNNRAGAEEVTGLGAGATTDGTNSASGSSAAPDSGGVTTTGAAWLAASVVTNNYPSVSATAGTGWTLCTPGTAGVKYYLEDRNEAASGTFNGTFTLPESNSWAAGIVAFKAAAASNTPPSRVISRSFGVRRAA